MAYRYTLGFCVLFLAAFIFTGNSAGAGASQGRDRSGSPLASGFCGNCHLGGDFGTEVAVRLLQGDQEVNTYTPGGIYTFQVQISASGDAQKFGFQAVALNNENHINAGAFGENPANTQLTTLDERVYFEHANKLDTNVFSIQWTAPSEGSGPVRFYAAGIAANNAGGSLGDDADQLDAPLTIAEGTVSSLSAFNRLDIDWQVFPNPVEDLIYTRLRLDKKEQFQLRLIDAQNRTLENRQISLGAGEHTLQNDLSFLSPGLYFMQLIGPTGISTRKVVKN